MTPQAIVIFSIVALFVGMGGIVQAHASSCTPVLPTDQKFGSSPTAAVVATSGTVSGDVNATGCDIGVYVPAGSQVTVTATIHDANQAGVFNDGGNVTISGSTVSNTGNHAGSSFAPNGVQTGIGVYYSEASIGSITGNTIDQYQKGGIVIRDLDSVYVTDNTVTGLGPFGFIAQNGIELGFGLPGATLSEENVGHVTGNTVTGNLYTQQASKGYVSTGILAEAISGSHNGLLESALQTSNTVSKNQANVYVLSG